LNEIRNWVIAGLIGAALVPLALNEWAEVGARGRAEAEVQARLADVGAALKAERFEEAVMAARAAAALAPTSAEARDALVGAEVSLLTEAPERTARSDAPAIGARLRRASVTASGEALSRLQVALGNVELVTGQGDPIAWYRLAAATHPESTHAQYYLGNALVLSRKHADAEDPLKKARKRLPQDPRPLVALGLVYEHLEKWALANEVLTEASELSPSAETFARLGRVRVEQEKWADAVEALERAVEGLPSSKQAPVLAQLGLALFHTEKHARAIGYLERANALAPSINTLFRLGVVREAAGQHGMAAGIFASVVAQDPNAGEAHARLVKALVAEGRADAARAAATRFERLAAGDESMTRYAVVIQRALDQLKTTE